MINAVRRGSTVIPTPIRSNLGLVLGVVGLTLWTITINETDFLKMGSYGLVSILGWPFFVGLAFVALGFTVELLRETLRPLHLIILIALLVLFIYGTACAVEPVAALPDSWIHTGFTQYIIQHGRVLNGYDARFSWPGGFSLAAVLVAFTGQANTIAFLRWFPLIIELAYLAPLLVIARFSGVSRRAAWLGVAIFYASNWIYQDYFSPQALNYLFFLVVVATVLACWQPKRLERDSSTRRQWKERVTQSRSVLTLSRLDGRHATTTWDGAMTLGAIGLLGLIFFASSMSHQLTPYALILALSACLVSRRLGRPELVLLLVVFAIGWLSLGASNFWIGHLTDIFGNFGQFGSTIGSNVTSRVSGAASHLLIVETRILLTVGLFLLAGVGFLRRSTDSRALEVLAGVPFLLLATQSYGGEGLLRVVLYGLPFTSLLAASALLPLRTGAVKRLLPRFSIKYVARFAQPMIRIIVIFVVLTFAVATTIVRGGNDAFESFSKGELAAVNYAYAHVHGRTIGYLNDALPIGQQDINTVTLFVPTLNGPFVALRNVGNSLLRQRPYLVILSQSEEWYGEELSGYPVGWEESLAAVLVNHGYKFVAHWTTASVLEASG